VFNWRNAIGLTIIFGTVAFIYYFLWEFVDPTAATIDWTGFVLLGMLGIAMGFGFLVLLKSSREL
jgi:hypothetical protein